jgi:hypothetical protein
MQKVVGVFVRFRALNTSEAVAEAGRKKAGCDLWVEICSEF